jgi:hypothetical protein
MRTGDPPAFYDKIILKIYSTPDTIERSTNGFSSPQKGNKILQ